ncbi:MAG: histidine kinase [Actinomycetota bacterium]
MSKPPIVTGVGDPSPAKRQDRRAEQLRSFILLDIACCLLAGTSIVVLGVTIIDNAWAVVTGVAVWIAAGVMALALGPLGRGEIGRAFTLLALANWGAALVCSFVAPFAWAITVLAAMLPAVAAGPYTTTTRTRVVAGTSFAIALGVAALGNLQDVTGLTDASPDWLKAAVLTVFTPVIAVLIARAGTASSAELQSMLDDTQRVNVELSESRSRLIVATDDARRQIERDLHDGAQQRLVGLTLQLSAARQVVADDPDRADAILADIREQVRLTQAELRALVRGVYPPVLTEHGLGPALRALADEQPRPVRADISTTARLRHDVEAAGYFSALEALQNASKHAGADATIELSLFETDEGLVFTITDDGVGFSDDDVEDGHGFTNMADRLGAADGHLEIRSEVGVGTTVRGFLPAT